MITVRFGLISAIIVASIATPWLIQRRAEGSLQKQDESIRAQAARLAQLTAENDGFSNRLAQAKAPPGLSQEEFSELLKLRGEIGQLRQAVAEIKKLRTANQKLQAAKSGKKTSSDLALANVPTGVDFWPKDQLAFAGYGSPQAALKSAFWAMKGGDMKNMLASMTPEAKALMEKEREKDGKSEADMEAEFKSMAESLTSTPSGFRVLGEEAKSDEQVIVTVYAEGDARARKYVLNKIGNDWKVHDVLLAGQDVPASGPR
ncbi:MAG TPA: hypothetical protein VH598_13210 [Verrucomicrobiae bacterium]|nr:hypothetical protein [Verrucomicrobiae bacterium]